MISDQGQIRAINKTLSKAGMCIYNGISEIVDESKWERVSMIKRIDARMPSTTNSLEATHGQLNACIPRRNEFWPSLFRLVKHITSKMYSYNELMKHTYQRIKRNIKFRCKKIGDEGIHIEIMFFGSTIEECQCGETIHESSLLRIEIPCSHRYFLGAKFPALPNVELTLKSQWDKAIFENTILNLEKEAPLNDNIETLKESAAKNIKRYSHFKNKATIREFVDLNFKEVEAYVMGKPIGYYEVIHDGIMHFKEMKIKKHQDDVSQSEVSETSEGV